MVLDNLLGLASEAESDAEAYEVAAREAVRGLVAPKGKVDPKILEREQFAAHGFAWIATYVAALRQMRSWAERGAKGELELLMLQSAFGEYLAQLSGGIAISQVEIVRPADLGLEASALDTPAVRKLVAGNSSAVRMRIAELIADGSTPATSARSGSTTMPWKRCAASSAASSTAKWRPTPTSGICATS